MYGSRVYIFFKTPLEAKGPWVTSEPSLLTAQLGAMGPRGTITLEKADELRVGRSFQLSV